MMENMIMLEGGGREEKKKREMIILKSEPKADERIRRGKKYKNYDNKYGSDTR